MLWANQVLWILTLLLSYTGLRRFTGRKGRFLAFLGIPALAFFLFSMAKAQSSHLWMLAAAAFFWIVCHVFVYLSSVSGKERKKESESDSVETLETVKTAETVEAVEVVAGNVNDQTGQSRVSGEDLKEHKPRLLDNPLPVPKRHVRKEMDYAFDPPPDQMEYDLKNYDMKDDYDLHTF